MLHDLIILLFINIRSKILIVYLFLKLFYNYDYLLLTEMF